MAGSVMMASRGADFRVVFQRFPDQHPQLAGTRGHWGSGKPSGILRETLPAGNVQCNLRLHIRRKHYTRHKRGSEYQRGQDTSGYDTRNPKVVIRFFEHLISSRSWKKIVGSGSAGRTIADWRAELPIFFQSPSTSCTCKQYRAMTITLSA